MKLIYFTLTKYFELVSLAVVNFLLADLIGPKELGKLIPVLLFITYSSFAPLGSPQLILRYSQLKQNPMSQYHLRTSANKLIWFGIIAVIFSAQIFISSEFLIWVCVISIVTILSSYLMAKSRISGNLTYLNMANLSFAITLLVLNITLVNDALSFLKIMALSKIFSLTILIFSENKFFFSIFASFGEKIKSKIFVFYTKKSFQMMINGLFVTLLMTFDRIIIQVSDMSLELKGSYQLSDMMATAIQMLASSVLVYYFPLFLFKLKRDKGFKTKYLIFLLISILGIWIFLPISILFNQVFEGIIFVEYDRLWQITPIMLHWKLMILVWSSLVTYYTAIGGDLRAGILTLFLIFLMFVLAITILQYFIWKPELLPLINMICASAALFFILIREIKFNAKALY